MKVVIFTFFGPDSVEKPSRKAASEGSVESASSLIVAHLTWTNSPVSLDYSRGGNGVPIYSRGHWSDAI